jgi:hypothetical protein
LGIEWGWKIDCELWRKCGKRAVLWKRGFVESSGKGASDGKDDRGRLKMEEVKDGVW